MKVDRFIPKAELSERVEAALDLARGKDVLHIGMGGRVESNEISDNLLQRDLAKRIHHRIADVARTLTGLDINPVAIEAMQNEVPGDYILADITERGLAERLERKFEVVLFLEVIEHLDVFRTTFENIHGLLVPNGVLVLSTINAFCVERFIKLLFRYESVHEEHTTYFSYQTMKRLLQMNDFATIDKFCFTMQRRDKFYSIFDRAGYHTMRITAALLPQYAEGILFVARATQSSTEPRGSRSENHVNSIN